MSFIFKDSCEISTSIFQYQCLCRVKTALQRAKENLSLTPDVIVSDLEEALAVVGEITGQTVSETVIHEIFSRFCVGK